GQLFSYSDASSSPYQISIPESRTDSGEFPTSTNSTYTYDEAGRLAGITHPDGATVKVNFQAGNNNQLCRTVTDEKGWHTQLYNDFLGRLVETRAFDGSQIISTKYQYNVADQIKKVVDPNGNYTTYEWDS